MAMPTQTEAKKNGRGPGRPTTPLTEAEKQKKASERHTKLMALASKRVSKAANALRVVGNLANYRPTEDEATKIINYLGTALNDVAKRLRSSSNKNSVITFSL